ncbi:MAG: DUF4405 domain-containing protein, partial [Planctomycetota bacterium]
MSKAGRNPFRLRSFISVLIGASAAALVATGAVLFFVPPGWVANQGWSLFGLSKARWQALHVSFAATTVAAGVLHLALNWRVFLSYFHGRESRRVAVRWEWILAVAAAVLVGSGTILDVPPFSSLGAARESVKDSWRPRGGTGEEGRPKG